MNRKKALILGLVALNALTILLSSPRASVLNALRYRAAMRSIHREDYDAAQTEFEKIAQTDPLDHRALRNLGQISHIKGDLVSATEYFARASHMGDPKALDSLTGLYLQQTNYTEVALLLPLLRKQARANPRIAEKLVAFSVATTNRDLWIELESGYEKRMYFADGYASNLLKTAEQFFSEKR